MERFNGTLKHILKKLCSECLQDWDRYLPALLFSYREATQERVFTGFSPFELLYGRTLRGSMQILKNLWTKKVENEETKITYQYILDLKARLEETCKLVHASLGESQKKQKTYYDRKTENRKLKPGDKVLLLLPTDDNKLLVQWKGLLSAQPKRVRGCLAGPESE